MGEVVTAASFSSPLGTLRAAATPTGVVKLSLPRSSGAGFRGWLTRHLPDAEFVESLTHLTILERELEEYFAGARQHFSVAFDLRGTPFQMGVWRALASIPYGETRSYADVARKVKRPNAFRAVGAASGANPLPILIPCHRVIASDGGLGGYGGGLEAKRRLLALEGSAAQGNLL